MQTSLIWGHCSSWSLHCSMETETSPSLPQLSGVATAGPWSRLTADRAARQWLMGAETCFVVTAILVAAVLLDRNIHTAASSHAAVAAAAQQQTDDEVVPLAERDSDSQEPTEYSRLVVARRKPRRKRRAEQLKVKNNTKNQYRDSALNSMIDKVVPLTRDDRFRCGDSGRSQG